MKNEFYKLKDVPKEKRFAHFFEYYLGYVAGGILLLSVIGYVLFGLLQPETDIAVLWLSEDYTLECENALRDAMHASSWDVNKDGKTHEMLTYIEFTDEYSNLSLQTMSEINTLVGGQEYSFFLVNDYAKNWMEKQEILGTWSDIGINKDGYLVVPVCDIPSLSSDVLSPLKDLYLVISSPNTGKNTEIEYERQSQELIRFLNSEGLL